MLFLVKVSCSCFQRCPQSVYFLLSLPPPPPLPCACGQYPPPPRGFCFYKSVRQSVKRKKRVFEQAMAAYSQPLLSCLSTRLPTNGCSHSNHIRFPIWANHSYGSFFWNCFAPNYPMTRRPIIARILSHHLWCQVVSEKTVNFSRHQHNFLFE